MGTVAGARNREAARRGVTRSVYEWHLDRGERWCGACARWLLPHLFGRNAAQPSGLETICQKCSHVCRRRLRCGARRVQDAGGVDTHRDLCEEGVLMNLPLQRDALVASTQVRASQEATALVSRCNAERGRVVFTDAGRGA